MLGALQLAPATLQQIEAAIQQGQAAAAGHRAALPVDQQSAPVFLAAADKIRLKQTVSIHVPVFARVEGEGALDLRIDDGNLTEQRLRIFEPPRFFEKFLEGRHFTEIPDMVARICGICPVAYQVAAAQALENRFGVELDPWAHAMRRAFYCGEWIQSHSLHIHLLAAPDFFGCNNAIELARIAPDEVRRGLRNCCLRVNWQPAAPARRVRVNPRKAQ